MVEKNGYLKSVNCIGSSFSVLLRLQNAPLEPLFLGMHFVKWVIELTTRLTPYGSPGPRDESRCDSHRLCHMTRWLILMAPNRACQMSRSNDAWGAGHALRTGSGLPSSAGRRVFAPLLLCHAGCTSLKKFKGLGKRERERDMEREGRRSVAKDARMSFSSAPR